MSMLGMVARSAVIGLGLVALWPTGNARAGLVNPGFEYGETSESDHNDASTSPSGGWFTTEPDHQIEVWASGYNGVPAYQGSNFVELNANAVGTLYQSITGIATGDVVDYHFAHRGRAGPDTMQLDITDVTTSKSLFSNQYTDDTTAWGFYSGSFTTAGGVASTDIIQFAYISISAAGGNPTVGNFLDAANFGIGANAGLPSVPEPMSIGLFGCGLAGLLAAKRRRAVQSSGTQASMTGASL